MPKILRAVQKVFGGALAAAGNIAQFGSLKAGAAAYTLDPKTLQALANYDQAWGGATIGNNSPPKQDRNALDYLFSRQLAYILQAGVPEWDADTIYFQGNLVSNGANPPTLLYSVTDNNVGNAISNATYWLPFAQTIAPRQALLKAWVYFNGQGVLAIGDSWNVANVVKNGTGDYTINFLPALDFANFGISMSCAQENALAATIMATRFPGDTKTVNALRMRTVSCFDSSGFDSPEVYVGIFSS